VATKAQVDRLAAGAESGTAGVAAFDAAQRQVKQSRDQAITQMQREGSFGPKALTTQLAGQLYKGAQTTLGNLASYGATAGFVNQQDAAGTQNYLQEANAALPLVRAEADRELGQRISLLNASRSGGGGGAGGAAQMSDSELRNYIGGAARQLRTGVAQDVSRQVAQSRMTPNPFSGFSSNEQLRQALLAAGNTEAAAAVPKDTAAQQVLGGYPLSGLHIQPFKTAPDTARQMALANIQQQLYGPGFSDVARTVGDRAGLDPNRVAGLFGPAEDAAYVNANQSLGLYTPPDQRQTVTGQTLDPYTAGRSLKLQPKMVQQYLGNRYFDWNGDQNLNSAFMGWVKQYQVPITTEKELTDARKQFEQSPGGGTHATPVVQDVFNDAIAAAKTGYDASTYWSMLQTDPSFGPFQGQFTLAMAMAAPMFDYYQALRQRQTQAPQAGAPSYAAPAGP
jgi:hypothetical protein